MSVPELFTGYAASSKADWDRLKPLAFTPKPFEDWDVDIKITHCGVCGSDLHTLRSEWVGPTRTTSAPCIPAHLLLLL